MRASLRRAFAAAVSWNRFFFWRALFLLCPGVCFLAPPGPRLIGGLRDDPTIYGYNRCDATRHLYAGVSTARSVVSPRRIVRPSGFSKETLQCFVIFCCFS